jgi:predicted DNA binding CopG/RHH family protein
VVTGAVGSWQAVPDRREPTKVHDAAVERRKDSRVTVRMSPEQYDCLLDAAKFYGVAPTTLARMLVNRGVHAILDEERRDRRFFGDDGG